MVHHLVSIQINLSLPILEKPQTPHIAHWLGAYRHYVCVDCSVSEAPAWCY